MKLSIGESALFSVLSFEELTAPVSNKCSACMYVISITAARNESSSRKAEGYNQADAFFVMEPGIMKKRERKMAIFMLSRIL